MASPAYMWFIDEQGNQINSNSKVEGREGACEVIGFEHRVYIPCDDDTGMLTGTRKHEALKVTKLFCPATPILNKACSSGKTLQQVKISWYQIHDDGSEKEYFRQTLDQVKVVSIAPMMANIKDRNKENYGHMEQVAFRYQKITWEYLDGNIMAEDQWNKKG